MKEHNCIVVLGPTASGKTHLACQLAYRLNGAIISADSRQVYQGLNIGTGKDLEEYTVNGKKIPVYLIDVVSPSEQFYLHQFMQELRHSFDTIRTAGQVPVICGGTGLYLDALRKDFSLTQIPENTDLRKELENKNKEELLQRLKQYPIIAHQHIDTDSKKRIIRGIEIGEYFIASGRLPKNTELPYLPYYIGIRPDAETRRRRIAQRLEQRLNSGLIEETESLLKQGLSHERLQFFGLEYKFCSLYLQGKISKEQLQQQLQTAIFQFAKRQMTWFRKMEREGVPVHWVETPDTEMVLEEIRKATNLYPA